MTSQRIIRTRALTLASLFLTATGCTAGLSEVGWPEAESAVELKIVNHYGHRAMVQVMHSPGGRMERLGTVGPNATRVFRMNGTNRTIHLLIEWVTGSPDQSFVTQPFSAPPGAMIDVDLYRSRESLAIRLSTGR